MNILLWRAWSPLYGHPATFSCLDSHSIGGTCSQLLWHARSLVSLGHSVQVLGVCRTSMHEEGVEFIGASDKSEQEQLLRSHRLNRPEVIFLEGGFGAAPLLKEHFPKACVVHVGQNIDRFGAERAWKMDSWIDLYAFVSPGHHSHYCITKAHVRHKFVLLRNVVPWQSLYRDLAMGPVEDKVVWVGAWTKKGLRAWAETMEKVLAEFPAIRWELYGPCHGLNAGGFPSHVFQGLQLPAERVHVQDLPLAALARSLATARVVLVSLGNETACISALDGHAASRPVLSGNDMVFKFNNPESTGIRVFRREERYRALTFLLRNPALCDKLGTSGRTFIAAERTEANQAHDLAMILCYSEMLRDGGLSADYVAPGPIEDSFSYIRERIQRKWPRQSSLLQAP